MRLIALLVLLLSACTAAPTAPDVEAIRIDHVIVGTADLHSGITEIERLTGVRPVIGGVHPGQGTRNALMSLGDGNYLEILALDPVQSVDNEYTRELRTLTSLKPIGWAVSAGGENAIRSELAKAGIAITAVEPGSRAKPDGSILRWTTFGYEKLDNPLAPFFIIWADQALHPSRTSPAGCRLTGLSIESPEAAALSRAIAPLRLGVEVQAATRDRMRLSLACPKGEVRL